MRPLRREPLARSRAGAPVRASLWAYAYLIVPAATGDALIVLGAAVDRANVAARARAAGWTGLLLVEPDATSILVVSDGPSRSRPGNRRVEGALRGMRAPFIRTLPMEIPA